MLNMKKGLAIVLAAATAITFAPVSTLTARAEAGFGKDDGYTTKSTIDSINFSSFDLTQTTAMYYNSDMIDSPYTQTSLSSTAASYTALTGLSATDGSARFVHLKEHNDLSKVDANGQGTPVAAYRITISKPNVLDASGNVIDDEFENLVTVTKATLNKNAITTTDVTLADQPNVKWNWNSANDTAVYTVDNTAGEEAAKDTAYKQNGADVNFVALTPSNKLASYSVSVKVEALSAKDNGTVLDSSTFTVNVPQNDETFTINPKKSLVAEGETVTIPYTVTNRSEITDITVTSDPDGLISAADADASNDALTGAGTKNGVLTIKALKAGETTVTVHAVKADGKDKASRSFNLKITPGNGKLRVTYNTADDATYLANPNGKSERINVKTRGQRLTFTDDAENTLNATTGVIDENSTTAEVSASGVFEQGAKAVVGADGKHFATTAGGTTYIAKVQTGAKTAGAAKTTKEPADAAEKLSEITATGADSADDIKIGQKAVKYELDSSYVLPAAKPVVANGESTVQISADSDSEAKVSYALVAASYKEDAALEDSTVTADASGVFTYKNKQYPFNPVSGQFEGDFDNFSQYDSKAAGVEIGSNVGIGDKIVYTTAAAKKYGAIDNNGLVTLKNSAVDTTLYVVVTAKASDKTTTNAKRKTSTFVVPIVTSETQPLQFYAASENGFAEVDTETLAADTQTASNKIYLSDDHTSDKIQVQTNIANQSAYVTGDVSSKDGKFSYDADTQTLSVNTALAKDGDTTPLPVKTSSAPGIAGTESAVFNVVYNKNNKNNLKLTLNDDAVSKTSPRTKVGRTTDEGATVVFENGLYVKDPTTGRMRRVKSTENEYVSVNVTTTGWVTYLANDGEVYVRAYAKKDGYNPTGYKYAKITYGQHATPNDLAVTEDRVVVKAGESAEVHATASTAISFSVDDTTVATAVSGGAIKVTGVKAGSTTLKVTAAGDSKKGIAEKTIEVPVVVTDANTTPENEVTVPGKVSKIKLYNVKGAKLKINYSKIKGVAGYKVVYKYKKNGKQVRKTYVTTKGSKTVSVPKNTSVKVWVRAYNLNSKGQRVNGSYKTASKKTDKK